MRLLVLTRYDSPFRDIEVFSLEREAAVGRAPDRGDDIERLFPAGARFVVRNAEAAQLDLGARAASADFQTPLAQDIERIEPFGHPYRVVVGVGQQHHAMPDTDRGSALADGAIDHFGRGGMGEA